MPNSDKYVGQDPPDCLANAVPLTVFCLERCLRDCWVASDGSYNRAWFAQTVAFFSSSFFFLWFQSCIYQIHEVRQDEPANANLVPMTAEKTRQKEPGMVIPSQVSRLDLTLPGKQREGEMLCFRQYAFHRSLLMRTLFDFPPSKISPLKSDIIDLSISADLMYTFVT